MTAVRFESPTRRRDLSFMPRRPRRCVSVRRIVYTHMLELAYERRVSVCGLIQRLVVDDLASEGMAGGLLSIAPTPFDENLKRSAGKGMRRSISMNVDVAARLDLLAEHRGTRVTTLVDGLCCDELERTGVQVHRVQTPDREYRNEGRPRRPKAPPDERWFGGYAEFGPGAGKVDSRIVEPRTIR